MIFVGDSKKMNETTLDVNLSEELRSLLSLDCIYNYFCLSSDYSGH